MLSFKRLMYQNESNFSWGGEGKRDEKLDTRLSLLLLLLLLLPLARLGIKGKTHLEDEKLIKGRS